MEQLEDLCILLHFSFFIYSIMPKKILLVTILITVNFHYFFFFMSAVKKSCSKKDNTILYLLCVALAISLIVIACLVYSIKKLKKSSYVYSNGKQSHSHHIKQSILGKYNLILTNVISSGDQENQQVIIRTNRAISFQHVYLCKY